MRAVKLLIRRLNMALWHKATESSLLSFYTRFLRKLDNDLQHRVTIHSRHNFQFFFILIYSRLLFKFTFQRIEGLKTPALIIVLGKGEHGVSCLFGLCNVLITSLSLLFARFDPYQVFEVSVCNKMAGLIQSSLIWFTCTTHAWPM